MSELTERQAEVLRFISGFYDAKGFPPTRAEIAGEFGIQHNGAQYHVEALKAKEMIMVEPNTARSIVLTMKGTDAILGTTADNVHAFAKEKKSERPHAGELCHRINKLINEYAGDLGTAEAIGVLEIVKSGLMRN